MKTIVLISMFTLTMSAAQAQEPSRPFEFGSTLFATYPLIAGNNYLSKGNLNLLNGLFFRYSGNRIGLRVFLSYSETYSSYDDNATFVTCFDCGSGDKLIKDFVAGAGIQYSIIPKKDWFYAFSDLGYRKESVTGHFYGGIAGAEDYFTSTSAGIINISGFGLKINLFKFLYLSPEFGYSLYFGSGNNSVTPLRNPDQAKTDHFNDMHLGPILKTHLSVKF